MGASLRVIVVGAGVGGISVARGLLRDGHDVTVYERRPHLRAAGGAVTIWSNGASVLRQLGVDMGDAGQVLSTVRVMTSAGCPLAAVDLAAVTQRLGAPVRMVPRRVLLQRLLDGFPADRIRCGSRAVTVVNTADGARVEFEDGSSVRGDVVIGADGLHSAVRGVVGAEDAKPTGWCSWQGLGTLPPVAAKDVAFVVIGEQGNTGFWPAGGAEVQWWFDLPWSDDFVRPERPIEVIRSVFTGWCEPVDHLLATLTDDDLAASPFPHFRHPIPPPADGVLTLLGDAAHTMPPTLAQGTNQALLDTMVLCKALADAASGLGPGRGDLARALRWYEETRRLRVTAVSRLASLPVAHGESALRPARLMPNRLHTWALTAFLGGTSHRRLSADVDRDLTADRKVPSCPPR